MKNLIIIILILFTITLFIEVINYEEPVYEECEIESCDLFVWHKNEKLCVDEDLKEYIEGIEAGEMDRLKSKRGVLRN